LLLEEIFVVIARMGWFRQGKSSRET